MPKKNLDALIINLDGTPADRGDGKRLPARVVIAEALINHFAQYDGPKKAANGELAFRIYSATGEQEFTPEELVAMKEVVGVLASPLIVKQVFDLLNE